MYSKSNWRGRNGMGIVLSKEIKDIVVAVGRRNDRVMSVKLCWEETGKTACAYAPHVGCEEEEKVVFWEQLDFELSSIPAEGRVILGDDLNGHIGRDRDIVERVHGEWGVGEQNEGGERVLDVPMAFDLAICNTFYI